MQNLFAYDFMIRALVAGIASAVIAPVIGMFLVTRRYSFMADTMAHVSLAGVAVGYLTGLPPVLTAMVTAVLAALWVEYLRSRTRVLGEAALVLFLSGGLATATVLLGFAKNAAVSLSAVLFGSITTVSTSDVWLIVLLGAAVLAVVASLYGELFAIAVDEDLAIASGLRVDAANRILVMLAAVTVSLSMRIVGVLLVGALMTIPVLAAMQWKQGFFRTLLLSIGFSVLAVIIGLALSFYLGLPSGGTIVLTAIGLFTLSAGKRAVLA